MALPPVDTLNAADQINQIPEPDRMNVGPKPYTPIALPGTGAITTEAGEKTSGFSQNYINAVLGAKPNYDPGHLQEYSGEDVYNPRYSSVLPGEDSEEAFAKSQPWYNKWANATIKMGATAAGTFWNGITSIPDTIAAAKNGSLSSTYDTKSGNAISKWLDNLENKFPNYYTHWEQDHPFMSAVPFSGGGANFWSDKFLKNMGFTVGAIGSAAVQDLVVGTLTEGIGEIPMIGGQVGKAALYLNKIFTGTDKVADLLQLGRSAGRTEEQLLSLKTLAQGAAAVKVTDGIRFATNLYGAAASEAGFEGRDGYATVKKDLENDYIKTHGYAPIDKDAAEIEKYATASANTRFGINLAILGMSDAIQFDNILKPFSAAKEGMRSSIQKDLEERIGAIALKKGSLDEFERVRPSSIAGRVWEKVRPVVPAILSEGVYEEGGQYAAQVGTQNYYERKYLYDKGMSKDMYKPDDQAWDARDNINNIIHAVTSGFAAEFGTSEGLENVFLGALTGAFSSGVEHFMDRNKNAEHRRVVLDLLNKNGVTGTLKSNYDTVVSSARITGDMKRAAKYGDIFKYKNFQHEQFVEFINSGIKAGRFDLRMQQLDMLKEMPDDEFKKAFGLDKTTANTKTVGEYVDALKEKGTSIKKSYDLINETFRNPYTFRNKTKTDDHQIENEKYQEFENWKNALLYYTSITPDANQRSRSIGKNIKEISAYINPGFVKDLTNRKSLQDYSKILKTQAQTLQTSLDSDLSPNKTEDRNRLNSLKKKIDDIERNITTPNHEDHTKLFEDLLNFQTNGEKDTGDFQVPKAAIQELMKAGTDLNRLDEYKKSANDAFEILSTKKGFEDFMKDVQASKDRYNEAMKPSQQATQQGTQNQQPTQLPVAPIPVVTVTGKNNKTKAFEQDREYFIPVNEGENPQKVSVVGQTEDGVTVQQEDGTQVVVPVDNFFVEDSLGDELDEELDNSTDIQDEPPKQEDQGTGPISKRSESKKDLAFAPFTTTDPPYDDRTTPDDNFQRRHQNFLFNMGSTDPNIFNQENKSLLRLVPVTYNTQKLLGLPDSWITDDTNNSSESPIRYMYVADRRNTSDAAIFVVDGKGNNISRLGDSINPSEIIYTNAPNTSLIYGPVGNEEERYTNKQGLDEKAVMDWYEEQRKNLLDKKDLKDWPLHQFTISRGIPNETNKATRNSIVDAGIVREEDLNGPVMELLTLGNVAVAGALNNEGEGISAHRSSVNMGDMGKPVFNFGGNMGFLDGRRLSQGEANNIFDLIKILSDRAGKDKKGIFQYLNKIIYLVNTAKGKVATSSSITIQGPNLFLGTTKGPILMTPSEIEANKDKIIDFLKTAFHNINNSELLRIAKNPKANDLTFIELEVKEGKAVPSREWANYNHYLLSNKYPSGSKRNDIPLTTKIVVPQGNEVPMIQKYSVIKGVEMDTKVQQSAQQQLNKKGTNSFDEFVEARKLGWSAEQLSKFTPAIINTLVKNKMTPEMTRQSREQAEKEQGTETVGTKEVEVPKPVQPTPTVENPSPKTEISKEEKVVEVVSVGTTNLGFIDVVRDSNGYITDITPVGTILENGDIKPFTNSDVVKTLILKKLQESQIKQDATNDKPGEDDIDSLMNNKNRKKGPDSQYRLNLINEKVYTKGDLDKEFAEFAKMLPNIPIHKVDQMLRTTSGGMAWGSLSNAMVYVFKNAEVGTTYHEAFEAVWGHFLTGREQQDIYDEFAQREGQFTTYTGKTKDFKNATVKEAKEQIAEEFRDYKQEKRSPKNRLERFFQSLIDFIKRFIFGDRSDINAVFRRINRGYYRGYATNLRNINEEEYSRPGLEQFSESVIQDTIQGMTVDMFMDLFKENQDIINQLEEHPEIAAKTIYDKLLGNLTHYFEENATGYDDTFLDTLADEWNEATSEGKEILRGQIRSVRELWGKVKGNWSEFVKEHKRYLKVFNVEYEIDDEGNIAFAEDGFVDENEGKNQIQYDRDIFSIDAKNAASPKVKLLVATIADSVWKKAAENSVTAAIGNETEMNRDNSSLTLPKQAQYAKLFNYLLHNMANVGDIYSMWEKMKAMTSNVSKRKSIDANVQRIMIRLGFEKGFKGKTQDQSKMIMAVEGVLAKQKPSFFRQFVDSTRNTFFKTSVLNSKLDQIKNQWISGMRASKAITVAGQGNFLFSSEMIDIPDNIDFLNRMGINIERNEYNRLKGKDVTRFNTAVNKIRGVVEKAAREEKYIPILSPREIDFNSRLDDLAELYISNISGDDSQSQHSNLDNEQTTNFVLPNYVSSQVTDANNSSNRQEFMDRIDNQFYNDIFHKDSILLNKLFFGEDGKRTDRQIEVGVVEGREAWNGENTSAANLSEAERQVYELNNNFNGVFYTLLPADAKTEWAIYVGTYVSAPKFFGSDIERRDEITQFARQMYQWLKTEIALAKDYPNRTNIEALNRKLGDRKVGNSLRFFDSILDQNTVGKIYKSVIDSDTELETIFTEPELRAKLIEYSTEKARKTLNNLLDWQLIDYVGDENTYKLNGFDKGFLNTYIGEEDRFGEPEVMKLLTFREMNYVMNNIEMHKFFFGDPGQFKDELKRIKSFLSGRENTHVDTLGTDEGYNQWANETLNKTKVDGPKLESTDPGYHQFKNHFNTFTIYDVKYSSNQIKEIEQAIGKERADPYTKGDEADAQAWISATAYREMMNKASGRFTAAQENYFQWAMAWERNDKAKEGKYTYSNKELKKADKEKLKESEPTEVYFPIIKLIHSGMQYENDKAIVSLDKASWAPLFYHWYKGTTLGELYNQIQEKGVDYVRMESAHKVGIQRDSSTGLYDKEGKYNSSEIAALKDERISMKHLGIQVEQAKKEKGQTEGSQARSIVPSDLRSNGVPVDFINSNNENESYNDWNSLTEDQKREASPIYTKIQRHGDAIKRLTEARTDQTMRRLGIENIDIKSVDGKWVVKDKRPVSEFILDELERRELPRNLAYGLEINPVTKDFFQPLEANAQYTKIRSIIYSVMEKTIMRPKVSGGQKTMLSVTGFEKSNRVVQREVNGKPVYTSDTLKFYTRGKDATEACEVMLPYWFGKQMMAMGSKRTKEEVIKYLNSTEEGRKLLTGIGFRIPTQGLNSVDFFVVKNFLPEQMGDVVVLPSEITAKAGSDFDIDKLNTYLRNFYVDNTSGYPVPVEWKGTEEKTREYIQKLLDKGNIISVEDKKELDRYLEEEKDIAAEINMDDLVMKIPGIASLFENERITRDFLAEGNYGKLLMDKVYIHALENEYFDSIEELLKLPESYSKLITPNDATQMKDDRTYIKGLIAEREGETDDNLGPYGKLLDSTFMMKERHAYLMSKGVVGTSAVSQVMHAKSQNIDGGVLVLDPDIVARFPHNQVNGMISLSGLTINGSDQYISNVNSQTTDGGVDVAKDKFLAEMGINKDTLGVYLAIRRMGSPRRWAELFLNQPSIQKYLKIKAIHGSISKVNTLLDKLPEWKMLNVVLKSYGFSPGSKKETEELMSGKPDRYSMEKMADMIRSKTLNNEQKKLQIWMLDDFLKYNSLGWDLFNYYQGSNWDTARLNDPNEMRLKQLKFMKANNQLPLSVDKPSKISPVGKIMSSTFIGTMKRSAERLNEGLKSIINVQIGAAGSILDDIAFDLFRQPGLTQYDRNQLMLATETSLVDFAVQTNGQINGKPIGEYLSSLLLGNKAVARYIEAMQDIKDHKIANNPFVKNLLPMIDKRTGWPSLTVLKERDYDTYTSNVWTDAFRELKDDATVVSINDNRDDDRTVGQIMKNLAVAAILQSGSKKTSNSMTHLIPNEVYSEYTRDPIKNMKLEGFYENNVFLRTNWNNDKLVPVLKPTWDEINVDEYWYPMLMDKDGVLRDTLKQLTGSEKPAELMNLESWRYSKYKAVKIKETRNLATGERYAIPLIRVFQRVDVQTEEGLMPLTIANTPKNQIFKEINIWGDGNNIQEYHSEVNKSVLPTNRKVDEITNDQLLYSLMKAGYDLGIADETIDAVTRRIDNSGSDMDDDGSESPDGDEQGPVAPVIPSTPQEQDINKQFEPEDNIDECGPSNFSIKDKE